MAQVRFASIDGQAFSTPERISGDDGPEIEIIVCEAGEFIDPAASELAFMPRPEPPTVIRSVEVQRMQAAAEVHFADKWELSEDEKNLAEEEGAEMRKLLRGYYQ